VSGPGVNTGHEGTRLNYTAREFTWLKHQPTHVATVRQEYSTGYIFVKVKKGPGDHASPDIIKIITNF
jgi:hypothetical protein